MPRREGRRMGRRNSPSDWGIIPQSDGEYFGDLGERREFSQRGSGRSSDRKRFYCNLISADRLCWQQVTANSSPFHTKNWWYDIPSPKSGDTGTPRTSHRKFHLCSFTPVLWKTARMSVPGYLLSYQGPHLCTNWTWPWAHLLIETNAIP